MEVFNKMRNKMKEPKLQLNKEELNLIRFYGGFDRVIFQLRKSNRRKEE